MIINSKKKGARVELLLAKLIRKFGFKAERSVQYCGRTGTEDLNHNIPGIYIECKGVENLNLRKALQQAIDDSKGTGKIPSVWHKTNRKEFLVTMRATDFLNLTKEK